MEWKIKENTFDSSDVSQACCRPHIPSRSSTQRITSCNDDTDDEQRGLHNVAVLPSGKALVSSGSPGRSAVTGHVATVFGASSFLGRYLVSKIGTQATRRNSSFAKLLL